jgi:hypothetical protein
LRGSELGVGRRGEGRFVGGTADQRRLGGVRPPRVRATAPRAIRTSRTVPSTTVVAAAIEAIAKAYDARSRTLR